MGVRRNRLSNGRCAARTVASAGAVDNFSQVRICRNSISGRNRQSHKKQPPVPSSDTTQADGHRHSDGECEKDGPDGVTGIWGTGRDRHRRPLKLEKPLIITDNLKLRLLNLLFRLTPAQWAPRRWSRASAAD